MTPLKILFATDSRGSSRIFYSSDFIRENPRKSVADVLRCPSSKRKQSDISRLFDGQRQTPLVRSANSGQTPWDDLTALRHELREQPDVFVIDGLNFLHAKLANLLAPKILAPTLAPATRPTRTRRTPLAIAKRRPVARWPISTRRTLRTRTCCCCSNFFSHDAP
jgi:hypothetical protein